MAKERQKIIIDLEALFPGDTLTVGDQVLDFRPLNVKQLAIVARKLKGFGGMLAEEGITWENYSNPENLLKMAVVLLEQFPDVLAEASNIDTDSLQELPIDIIVEILDKVIDVNLKSKEKLMGNFESLTQKLNPTQVAQTSSKSSKRSKN